MGCNDQQTQIPLGQWDMHIAESVLCWECCDSSLWTFQSGTISSRTLADFNWQWALQGKRDQILIYRSNSTPWTLLRSEHCRNLIWKSQRHEELCQATVAIWDLWQKVLVAIHVTLDQLGSWKNAHTVDLLDEGLTNLLNTHARNHPCHALKILLLTN